MKDGEYKVHIVASVLKKYLGDLPKSVIPPENYDQFIAVGGCKIFIYFFFKFFHSFDFTVRFISPYQQDLEDFKSTDDASRE